MFFVAVSFKFDHSSIKVYGFEEYQIREIKERGQACNPAIC